MIFCLYKIIGAKLFRLEENCSFKIFLQKGICRSDLYKLRKNGPGS